MIKYCGCNQDKKGNKKGAQFQDRKLGTGNRYHTEKKDGSVKSCTVCGKGGK